MKIILLFSAIAAVGVMALSACSTDHASGHASGGIGGGGHAGGSVSGSR